MSDPEKCNQDVFKHGEVFSVTEMGTAEAEAYCKEKSAETGDQYDWHFAGGRAVIKVLTKARAAELVAEKRGELFIEAFEGVSDGVVACLYKGWVGNVLADLDAMNRQNAEARVVIDDLLSALRNADRALSQKKVYEPSVKAALKKHGAPA